ncbi:MFS transporter [Nonomuraea sp. K274]|uniref:MFS transporter n=1 Tax=Nonomuraea cypriaca TaxID=1187855 RepID=A0A931A7Q9_9ACTN|nr:MFS transporter [Nonomuraea cypriaca]MBF8185538.1 MFS transporter [Nonomuraea cypriaca]
MSQPPKYRVPVEAAPVRRRFRVSSLTLLITGQGFSGFGDQFFVIALPGIVLLRHGSAALGLVLTVYGVCRLVGLMLGGPLADRFTPRRIMLVTDTVRAPAAGLLCALAWTGETGLWALAVATAILGLAGGAFLPANFSIIPDVVEESQVQRANSRNYAVAQAVALLGPVIAGVLVARLGTGPALAVDALSFLVSVVTLWFVRPHPDRAQPEPAPRTTGVWTVLREFPLLKVIMMMAAAGNLGFAGILEIGLPTLLHQGEPGSFATTYGIVLGAFGCGALAGSVAAGLFPTPRNPVRVAVLLMLPQAALLGAVGLISGQLWPAALFLGAGAANAAGNVLLITVVQTGVPAELRGRVSGALLVASFGLFPVGALLAGLIASAAGPRMVFLLGAALVAAAGVAGLLSRPVRTFAKGGESHDVRDERPEL